MKRIITLTLLLVFSLTWPASGEMKIPDPPRQFYCLDEAQMLTPELEAALVNTSAQIADQSGAQIVVVTLETLNGESLEEVSLEILRSWGIGDAQKNNGVLILVAREERLSRIEVGYGLEGAIPDGKAGRILDEHLVPNLQRDNYSLGILETYNAVLEEVCREYNLAYQPLDPNSLGIVAHNPGKQEQGINWWVVALIIMMLYLYFRFSGRFRGGGGYRGGGGTFWGGPWRGGGGGFGGGGFGGRGGSGGGGGASRGW
ncbi:MAG TPA: TPM domain-containing protein [Syntrophomonadaceae bacterium]|nr:TPM domain-containing protein [Syntrophomonadaceae bacterium]HPU49131.1 TPM domain-containing protein [Syntrophomonadaceae bacterium]